MLPLIIKRSRDSIWFDLDTFNDLIIIDPDQLISPKFDPMRNSDQFDSVQ